MPTSRADTIRYAGIAGIVGGTATAVSGLLVQAVIQPSSTVSTDSWSYPWSAEALVPVSLIFAVLHALVFVGILGFARSGAAGRGRPARIGASLALAGTALYVVAELASIPIRDERADSLMAGVVGTAFGVATALSAIGFLMAGVASVRAGRWTGWRRVTPLATGLWLTVLIALAVTPALSAGVGIYGLFIAALGVAVVTDPDPDRNATVPAGVHAPMKS